MEENKDYRVYRYGDDLKPGYELKVEHSVSCENVDISALIAMGTESLEAMCQGSIDGEQKAYEIVWLRQSNGTAGRRRHRPSTGRWNICGPRRLLIHLISGSQRITGGMAKKSATVFIR